MQKKNKKIIGFGIVILAVIILLLVLIFFKEVNKQDKNKLAVYENTPAMLVGTEPNVPKLSAGMIPIKWNGENFVITTKDDSEWLNSQPAYMMLNDGYYKSELERGIKNEQLMQNAVGVGVPDDPSIRGTIFMWIPRFVYNADGEIGYIKEETTPGEGWTVPDLFMYKTSDETKPDFSLSGVWVEKDIDTTYSTKITQMNQEESIYRFIANTKATQITTTDTNAIQKYVGVGVPDDPFADPANVNRIILKIVDNTKHEPIKANIIHNTVDKKIEIRVTYTANGISKILNDYGEEMILTEENGVILTDTGASTLGKGTYKFTVIDNKGNKQELSIEPIINSLFKVAYINGTDNMDNLATYNKSNETVSSTENALLNQVKATDTSKTYSRAIKDTNGLTTAVSQRNRTSEDETWDFVGLYNIKYTYSTTESKYTTCSAESNSAYAHSYGYSSYSIVDLNTIRLSDKVNLDDVMYSNSSGLFNYKTASYITVGLTNNTFYKFVYTGRSMLSASSYNYHYDVYKMRIYQNSGQKGTLNRTEIIKRDTYTDNAINGSYWYEKGGIAPKYTLYKYDQNLNLKSTYDVDTKTLTTESIDISNKGKNKVKLNLSGWGSGYKVYISNNKVDWQEVTDIAIGTPKELNVDGWNDLYIKIETNSSTITNIDIAYYKD